MILTLSPPMSRQMSDHGPEKEVYVYTGRPDQTGCFCRSVKPIT